MGLSYKYVGLAMSALSGHLPEWLGFTSFYFLAYVT